MAPSPLLLWRALDLMLTIWYMFVYELQIKTSPATGRGSARVTRFLGAKSLQRSGVPRFRIIAANHLEGGRGGGGGLLGSPSHLLCPSCDAVL